MEILTFQWNACDYDLHFNFNNLPKQKLVFYPQWTSKFWKGSGSNSRKTDKPQRKKSQHVPWRRRRRTNVLLTITPEGRDRGANLRNERKFSEYCGKIANEKPSSLETTVNELLRINISIIATPLMESKQIQETNRARRISGPTKDEKEMRWPTTWSMPRQWTKDTSITKQIKILSSWKLANFAAETMVELQECKRQKLSTINSWHQNSW